MYFLIPKLSFFPLIYVVSGSADFDAHAVLHTALILEAANRLVTIERSFKYDPLTEESALAGTRKGRRMQTSESDSKGGSMVPVISVRSLKTQDADFQTPPELGGIKGQIY
jgi:hypothetical protein